MIRLGQPSGVSPGTAVFLASSLDFWFADGDAGNDHDFHIQQHFNLSSLLPRRGKIFEIARLVLIPAQLKFLPSRSAS